MRSANGLWEVSNLPSSANDVVYQVQAAWRISMRDISTLVIDSIVIVVSPLNALISNQISRLRASGIRASVINVKKSRREQELQEHEVDENMEGVEIDFWLCEEKKLCDGHYHIVFAHPETFISVKYGRELLLSKIYQENVVAIVVDEAHCILEW